MRKYRYITLDENDDISPLTITLTEKEILDDYYLKWAQRMHDRNLDELINEENCIKDYVKMHWAWEVKE